MSTTDEQIEQDIKAAGADVAPRVTLADIEDAIASEVYFTGAAAVDALRMEYLTRDFPRGPEQDQQRDILQSMSVKSYSGACHSIDSAAGIGFVPEKLGRITFCVITLRNGLVLVGVNASSVHGDNHNAELGKKYAHQSAIDQAWPMFGFALAERLYQAQQPPQAPTEAV